MRNQDMAWTVWGKVLSCRAVGKALLLHYNQATIFKNSENVTLHTDWAKSLLNIIKYWLLNSDFSLFCSHLKYGHVWVCSVGTGYTWTPPSCCSMTVPHPKQIMLGLPTSLSSAGLSNETAPICPRHFLLYLHWFCYWTSLTRHWASTEYSTPASGFCTLQHRTACGTKS